MSDENNPFFLMGAMLGEKSGDVADLRRRIEALIAERDALAEKLAATNEKLKHIVDEYDSLPWGPVIRAIAPARATLAQITGDKTDDHTD